MAVWRCQHLLADIVAGLPIDQYRNGADDVRQEVTPSAFVRQPSQFVDASEWRYQMMLSALDRGNAFAYVTEFDSAMRYAVKAEVLDPRDVTVERRGGALAPPTYYVGTSRREVDSKRILHLRAFGPMPGSVLGMSPIDYAASTIGLNLSSREFGAKWYDDGGHPTAMLSADADIGPEEAQIAKKRYHDAIRDDNLLVLGKTWNYQSLQVDPEKALFLDSINATSIDICGFYGIPPEFLGYSSGGEGSLTYANREQRALDLLVFTVQWWIGRMERLISTQTPSPQYVKINVDALLRSDIMTRYKVHDMAIRSGMSSPDDRRKLEDQPPIPGDDGDQYLWPPYASTVDQTEGAADAE